MVCFLYRILTLRQAIETCEIHVLNGQEDRTNDCQWSWSADGVCWSPWTSYDSYLRITPNLESDFYLRIRLSGLFTDIIVGGCRWTDYSSTLDQTNIFLQEFCTSPTLFQPYQGMDCALQLQKQLSDQIICIFGIPIYYVQVDPNIETKDYTFKEYVLHGVKSIKQIKLMLQDGQLPSSNPQLTELDFTWETDWDVELSKTQFGAAFGDTAFPKRRDLVWVPMMKRLWMVNSAYDEKSEGLLYRSTTWKLSLVKYTEDSAIDQGNFEDVIDSWTKNKYEELFHVPEMIEAQRTGGAAPLSAPDHAATNTYPLFMADAVRAGITTDYVKVIERQYNHLSNVVARNAYVFSSPEGQVTYQSPVCGSDGTLMMLLELRDQKEEIGWRTILRAGEVTVEMNYEGNKYGIRAGELEGVLDPFGIYMLILFWNKSTRSVNLLVFKQIDQNTRRPKFDFENPSLDLTGLYNEDYDMRGSHQMILSGWPAMVTDIKLYNETLPYDEALKESIKYLTTRPSCVTNDQARPLDLGHGYSIR